MTVQPQGRKQHITGTKLIRVVQDCLLQAALSPPADSKCKAVVEMAASVGVMYLSTMAGNLEAPTLVMLATLLNNNSNLVMVENLMAAVWILLRNPHNRKILGTAFDENPVMSSTIKGQMKVWSCLPRYAGVWCHASSQDISVTQLRDMDAGCGGRA